MASTIALPRSRFEGLLGRFPHQVLPQAGSAQTEAGGTWNGACGELNATYRNQGSGIASTAAMASSAVSVVA